MPRICHIVSGDLWAGAEVMVCHLLRGLSARPDLDLSVILLNDGRLARELHSAGLRIHVVEEQRNSFLQIARKAGDVLRHDPPQIIHSHRYKENLLAFVLSRRLPGTRLISTLHGLPEVSQTFSLRRDVISRFNLFLLRHFFRTVAVSYDIRRRLLDRYGFRADRVAVIHNGIVAASEGNRRRRRGEFVIGSSGRLFPVKDYPLMVRIAEEIAERRSDVRFVLAGEGPLRRTLERLIADGGLERRFELPGHLESMDFFYRELDLYLNTSLHEGIPMTILEAMAQGLPVVAPRVGGIGEIVEDGREGFLIDERTPRAFAEACLLLQQDEALWKRMSSAARKRALADFSVERMSDDYSRLYQELAAGRTVPEAMRCESVEVK